VDHLEEAHASKIFKGKIWPVTVEKGLAGKVYADVGGLFGIYAIVVLQGPQPIGHDRNHEKGK